MDVRSRHRTNPRSTRFVLGKASESRRRPRSCHVDPSSRRREVAHGALCSSGKPEQTICFASERRGIETSFSSDFYTPVDDTPSISVQNNPMVDALRVGQSQRKIDGDLRNCMWIHGIRGDRSHIMRSLPKPEKCLFFCHRR